MDGKWMEDDEDRWEIGVKDGNWMENGWKMDGKWVENGWKIDGKRMEMKDEGRGKHQAEESMRNIKKHHGP